MKQTVVFAVITLMIIAASAVGVAFYRAAKPTPTPIDDMAAMHAPPPPADEAKFKSLLGNQAPGFSLQSYDGKTIDLASLKGKNVVLFF